MFPSAVHHPDVSIHAPVRGATKTFTFDDRARRIAVSIHAPVRGATDELFDSLRRRSSFNPRARTGRDPGPRQNPAIPVSIHAPVRGATYAQSVDDASDDVSIHAPVRGATDRCIARVRLPPVVVSITRPYGARRYPRYGAPTEHRLTSVGFNPRARTGRDLVSESETFQSTRPYGARPIPGSRSLRFQSTRPYGARRDSDSQVSSYVSIHAPVRGATRLA